MPDANTMHFLTLVSMLIPFRTTIGANSIHSGTFYLTTNHSSYDTNPNHTITTVSVNRGRHAVKGCLAACLINDQCDVVLLGGGTTSVCHLLLQQSEANENVTIHGAWIDKARVWIRRRIAEGEQVLMRLSGVAFTSTMSI